jgi:hypothetical protein
VVSERRAEEYIADRFFDRIGDLHATNVQRRIKQIPRKGSRRQEVPELADVDAQIARLVELVAIGQATHRAVDRKLHELEERRQRLEQERAARQVDQRSQEDIEAFRERVADLPAARDSVFPLESAAQARSHLDASDRFGKIVLQVR